jgi:capsid protein
MIKSDRPNPNLETFRNGQLRAVAAGSRGSFSSIARNYDGTYSAQRQELVESTEGYFILQDCIHRGDHPTDVPGLAQDGDCFRRDHGPEKCG